MSRWHIDQWICDVKTKCLAALSFWWIRMSHVVVTCCGYMAKWRIHINNINAHSHDCHTNICISNLTGKHLGHAHCFFLLPHMWQNMATIKYMYCQTTGWTSQVDCTMIWLHVFKPLGYILSSLLATCFQASWLHTFKPFGYMLSSLLATCFQASWLHGVQPSGFMVAHSCKRVYAALWPCFLAMSYEISMLATCCTWVKAF